MINESIQQWQFGHVSWLIKLTRHPNSKCKTLMAAMSFPSNLWDLSKCQASECHQNLEWVWTECQFGAGNDKSAKSFANAERIQQWILFKMKHSRCFKTLRAQVHLHNVGVAIEADNAKTVDAFDSNNPAVVIKQTTIDQQNQSCWHLCW